MLSNDNRFSKACQRKGNRFVLYICFIFAFRNEVLVMGREMKKVF